MSNCVSRLNNCEIVADFFFTPTFVPIQCPYLYQCSTNESVTKKSADKGYNFHTAWAASHAWRDGGERRKEGGEIVQILSQCHNFLVVSPQMLITSEHVFHCVTPCSVAMQNRNGVVFEITDMIRCFTCWKSLSRSVLHKCVPALAIS